MFPQPVLLQSPVTLKLENETSEPATITLRTVNRVVKRVNPCFSIRVRTQSRKQVSAVPFRGCRACQNNIQKNNYDNDNKDRQVNS